VKGLKERGKPPKLTIVEDYFQRIDEIFLVRMQEWEAPKARHAVLLNSLLTTRFNEREAENLWEPPDSEGWEPCTQPLSEPCMLSSTLGTFQFKDCKECMLDLPCFLFLVCFPMSSDVCLVECSSACRIKRLLTSIFGRRTQSTAYGG
jgi:hypothetical protein